MAQGNRLFGAILLVSGTTIGAAMLALPLTTGLAGFFPSVAILLFIWLYMMLTAYYLLEVNLRMPGESNIISMASKTVGRWGQVVCWIVYLMLLYSLLAAYLVGCSEIVGSIFDAFFPLPLWEWALVLLLLFATFIFFGTSVVDWLNRLLMIGLVVTFGVIVSMGVGHVSPLLLTHTDWKHLLPSFSVVLTTLGYHIIIPTLSTYLEHDVRALKKAIFIGSLIPFVLYLVWQFVVMGVIPVKTLAETAALGEQVTLPLRAALHNVWIGAAARLFALFSIITSLLGVSLSLSDFLADGLKIEKKSWNKLWIVALTFLPPLIFTLLFPHGFLRALKYAGICVAILLALLPAWMAYYERYGPRTERSLLPSHFKVFGGKPLVFVTIILAFVILGIEILK